MRARELILLVLLAGAARAEKEPGAPLDFGSLGGDRKDPITVTADTLEFDYKANVITYRGNVLAVQADVKIKSDTLTITLAGQPKGLPLGGEKKADGKPAGSEKPAADGGTKPAADPAAKPGGDAAASAKVTLQTVVAAGNVRIDQAARWATGGRAVFDQTKRTVVLSDKPVLHEGQNEVSGERIVVYLDENRSVVEGGPAKRVQAILYPQKGGGLAPAAPPPGGTGAEARAR